MQRVYKSGEHHMFKVTQVKSNVVKGVWFQSARSKEQALQTIKSYYARGVKGSEFRVEEVCC